MSAPEKKSKKALEVSIAVLICAVFAFVAGLVWLKKQKNDSANYTPEQITHTIITDLKYTDLVKVEDTQVAKHYDIPDGTVVSCSVYLSSSSESAAELSCFLLTDSSKYDVLQTALSAHISSRATGFQSLNPTQYQLLKNCQIVHTGRYVLVAVGSGADEEAKIFNDMLS